MSPAARRVDSSVGRALHQYRRGHCLIQSLRYRFRPASVTHFQLFRGWRLLLTWRHRIEKAMPRLVKTVCKSTSGWLLNIEKPSDAFWKVWILRMQTLYSKIHFNMRTHCKNKVHPFYCACAAPADNTWHWPSTSSCISIRCLRRILTPPYETEFPTRPHW